MSEDYLRSSSLLSLPMELRNLIFHEVARTYILNISPRDRQIILADQCVENACCSMHSKRSTSTATSLALVSRQVALEARQAAFHRTRSPVSIYFASTSTLSDFEQHHKLYQPPILRDLCLSAAQKVLVKAPSAWQALPLPGKCFEALGQIEVTGIAKVFHLDVLRVSISWCGWEKDQNLSGSESWTFVRIS
jgi:hypothetical protein